MEESSSSSKEEREMKKMCSDNKEEGEACDRIDLDMVEILPKFLYLGSYNAAYNCFGCIPDHKRVAPHGISHLLNTIPGWQHLFNGREKNSILNFHSLQDNDAIQFLDQCEKDKAAVLVFCMTGNSRSPGIVIAYLMKYKRWTLEQSYQWVKERRPSVNLSPGTYQWLEEFEKKIFDSGESNPLLASRVPEASSGLGSPGSHDPDCIPALANLTVQSGFDKAHSPISVESKSEVKFRLMGWPHNKERKVLPQRKVIYSNSNGKRTMLLWFSGSGNEQVVCFGTPLWQNVNVCTPLGQNGCLPRKRRPKPVKDGQKV